MDEEIHSEINLFAGEDLGKLKKKAIEITKHMMENTENIREFLVVLELIYQNMQHTLKDMGAEMKSEIGYKDE